MGGTKRKKREKGGGGGTRKREGDGFMGVEERGYSGGQDLILDRYERFSVFHHPQKDKQRKHHHSLFKDR